MKPKNNAAFGKANNLPQESRLFRRALLLFIAGGLASTLLNISHGRAQTSPSTDSTPPSFEVASIKPNKSGDMRVGIMLEPGRFRTSGSTAKMLIGFAYNVKNFQISGGPGWMDSDRYNVDAKEDDALVKDLEKLPPDQRADQIRARVQTLLAERFKLSISRTTKEMPVYALLVGKNGSKLKEYKPDEASGDEMKGPDGRPMRGGGMMRMGPGEISGQGIPAAGLARMLSQILGRDVEDKTGLKGQYDFTLKYTPEQGEGGMFRGPGAGAPGADSAPPPENSGPSIFTALQEQLGLKLDSQKGPVEILVIDHIEKPSED